MIRLNINQLLLVGFVLLVSYGAYDWWQQRPLSRGPGVLAPDTPEQVLLSNAQPFMQQGYRIKPLADYRLQARVIGKERYRFDNTADLSPLDLALGWGPLSDERLLDKVNFNQASRWLSYTIREPQAVSLDLVAKHTANVHIIPANTTVENALQRVRPGHVVALSGYLVEVKTANGGRWLSSLSREDTGKGACEIFWVDNLLVQ